MHDCMEGVIPTITEAIISSLVNAKITTIAQLNNNMQEFNFMGLDAVNKPESIKAKGNTVGSASQKMCLFRLLPFFVDISKSAMVLKLYLVSREIMMHAFSRCISRQDLDYYAQKIKVLYQLMKEHFSHIRITPKFYYLLHYPSMTAKFEPLRNLWCMRFEAKHQYFKALASNIGSFRNITFTLATRHQLSHCYNFSNKEVLESRMCVNNRKSILINVVNKFVTNPRATIFMLQ